MFDLASTKIINSADVIFYDRRAIDQRDPDEQDFAVADIAFPTDVTATTALPTDNDSAPAHERQPEPAPTKSRRSERLAARALTNTALAVMEALETPLTHAQAMASPQREQWLEAEATELRLLNSFGTYEVVPRPEGARVLKNRFVYAIKRHADGSVARFKARLVACGYGQVYNEDYFETYAPVARTASIRIFMAVCARHKLKIYQFDVPSAYVQSRLDEEVYMAPPPGVPTPPNHVCRLHMAIYGLKQAGRCWNAEIDGFLLSLGFAALDADPCIYRLHRDGRLVMLALYVDDIILAHHPSTSTTDIVSGLIARYGIKTLGPIGNFLGMDFDQREDGIFVNQARFITELLSRFNMTTCRTSRIPMVARTMLRAVSDEDESVTNPFPDLTRYRQIIGGLTWLVTCSRPAIAFAVARVSKFSANPHNTHWAAVAKILEYLQLTKDLVLAFHVNSDAPTVQAMSDADFANCLDTRRSISGMLVQVYGNPCIWSSRQQQVIATSSTESEYLAACATIKEVIWTKRICVQLGLVVEVPITIYMDNKKAIGIIDDPKTKARTRHLEVPEYYVKEKIEEGLIKARHRKGTKLNVDALTKALAAPQFVTLRRELGLEEWQMYKKSPQFKI